MTTLNAKANTAYHRLKDDMDDWPYSSERDAMEAAWEDGYTVAQVEILRAAAEAWGDGNEGFPYDWLLTRAAEIEAGQEPDWSDFR